MKKRHIALIAGLLTVISASGVYATWNYSGRPDPIETQIPMNMKFVRPMSPEQKELIADFTAELNNADSVLHDYVDDRRKNLIEWINWFDKTTLGSMDDRYANQLKELFDLTNSDSCFMLEFKYSNGRYTGYSLYITDEDLSQYSRGQTISPIYQIPYTYNEATKQWEAGEAVAGAAPYRAYDAYFPWQSGPASFNVDEWKAL